MEKAETDDNDLSNKLTAIAGRLPNSMTPHDVQTFGAAKTFGQCIKCFHYSGISTDASSIHGKGQAKLF